MKRDPNRFNENFTTTQRDRWRSSKKLAATAAVTACLAFILCVPGCSHGSSKQNRALNASPVAPQLKQFAREKAAQAAAAASSQGKELLPEFKSLFAEAANGDWTSVNKTFDALRRRAPQYADGGHDRRLHGIQWEAVKEVWGAMDAFGEGDPKYSAAFGNSVIASIPPGSIYFGGTDPGRFVITALEKSQVNADPFFTLTQNALADNTYLDYVRSMYGTKIYIPTVADSQRCFESYIDDARRRLQEHKLKPGEDVRVDDNGKVQVSGQVAVMAINGLLARVIFDKNPDHEFYVEESFPLDWMYPYLEPHCLIMKIDRQPMSALSEEIVSRDHAYWTAQLAPMIGGWLADGTKVEEISGFARKMYRDHDFNGFKGDRAFVLNDYSQKLYSKLRSSIAGLYIWRMEHAADASEKGRMAREADFAFRQAWALCPYSPEAVFRYVNFLVREKRNSDALLVAETASQMPESKGPQGEQLRRLVAQLKSRPAK